MKNQYTDKALHVARPKIDAGNLDLPSVSQVAWRALLRANTPPLFFRYGGPIAEVNFEANGAPAVRLVNENRMRSVLGRVAWWYKFIRDEERNALPPVHVVRDMLAMPDIPLPVLSRIVEAPVFAPDGTLQTNPGYHDASRCYYAPTHGLVTPGIPQQPTPSEVSRALTLITQELLGDFPFVGDAELAHAVALLLLPFVRELIDGPTPLHLIEKPAPGTGAGLIAEMLTYPFLGHAASVMAEGRDDDEWRKRITAKLMTGESIILIDNIRSQLDSSALSAALTGLSWEDRILGHSRMVKIPVRVIWVATGNNPGLSNEMARRTVRIRLDSGVGQPWLRTTFRHPDLRGWAIKHRPELIWAALTIVQAWMVVGKPDGKIVMGSFEHWSKVIGGILEANGIPGFLENIHQLYDQSDAEGQAWKAFVEEWQKQFGSQEVGVSKLYKIVAPINGDPIDLNLGDGTERSQKTRLGRLLMKNRNRKFGALTIVASGTKKGAQQWKLIIV
jgi:putative DNA primase/helicase